MTQRGRVDDEPGNEGDLARLRAVLERSAERTPSGAWHPASPVEGGTLLGAVVAARPTAKLIFERKEGALGLCLVEGRVLAAAMEGKRLFEDPAIARDPSLALAIDMWAEPTRDLEPRLAMFTDLGFTCEYDQLFAKAEGFASHVTSILVDLATHPCEGIELAGHAPSEYGIPLPDLALRAIMALPPDERRARIGAGVLRGPDGIPAWLRTALPPARFGRLFFALADGVTLEELPLGKLDRAEAEAAILLGLLTGVVTTTRPPRAPTAEPVDRVAPATHAGSAPSKAPDPPTTRRARRPKAPTQDTPPMGTPGPPDDVAVKTPVCGTAAGFFAVLGAVAEDGRKKKKRTRLTGTRFEPIGKVAGDLHAYYGIGDGAYGSVQIAMMSAGPLTGHIIAAKRLREEHLDHAEIVRRFDTEAALLALTNHENVVRGLGRHTHGRDRFILMELVHGVTLTELTRALHRVHRKMPELVLRHIGACIARGLAHVHDLRSPEGAALHIVHRDVAPPNILLGFGGEVKLADFSTAQGDDPRFAPERRGARSGRLGYMSPESLIAPPTVSADVYALGACLYEVATGHRVVEADSQAETLQAVVKGSHVPVLDLAPDLSPQLAYLIERAIAPHPADRYRTAQAFADALSKGLEGHGAGELVHLLDELFGAHAARELEAIVRMSRFERSHTSPPPPPLPGELT